MIQKLKDFIKHNRHVWILLYWPVHGTWYALLQAVTLKRDPVAIVCGLDKLIPFSEWFIIPYVLWYLQIAGISLYMFFRSKQGFTRLYIYMFGGMFICMLICTVFPMYFDRGGMVMYPRDNLLTDLVRFLQGFDMPTTVLPSMHVYVTLGLHFAVCKEKALASVPMLRTASLAFSLSVCLATVFIKQHSVLDVVAALPLCLIMYFVAYKPGYKKVFSKLKI